MTDPAEPHISESARLRGLMSITLPVLFGSGRRLWASERIAELYPEYLFATHAIIRASVPLMETAMARCRALAADGDEVARRLRLYLEGHVEEERHHDAWLLEDMVAVGMAEERTLLRPPSAAVAAFVGAQYYWTLHHHPVALMGYIALLEGYPIEADEVAGLRERTGYPESAFRTLALHGELDPHHAREFDEALDGLPLAEHHRQVVGLSALASVRMMTDVIDEILARG